jgi:hypothetical protein
MTYTKADIVSMLETSDYACERALLALYARQTADEQQTQQTRVRNAQGFCAFDAEFFSSLAHNLLSKKQQHLTVNQLACLRKRNKYAQMRIAKYAQQLADIANARHAVALEHATAHLATLNDDTALYERKQATDESY